MEWRDDGHFGSPLHLPPRELWRFVPGEDEPLPTPVDERGLVDVKQLIAAVKTTVDPEFTWRPSARPDEHHLYWEHNQYLPEPDAYVDPREFCDLEINKILVPRMFHEWTHKVTLEPPRPSRETMFYRIETQRVVSKLLHTVVESEGLEQGNTHRYITEERQQRGLQWHFEEFCSLLERAKTIPSEFHPYDFSRLNPRTNEDMYKVRPILARLAMRDVRIRDVEQPLAA